jgi:hypothetical protein
MDPRQVATKDGKAFGTNLVTVEEGYVVHSDYELALLSFADIGETGLLKVFEVTPNGTGKPGFVGRWDEKKNRLDVDITGVTEEVTRLFQKGRQGYLGHHPDPLPGPERRFPVVLRVPDAGMVFSGVLSFGLRRKLALGLAAQAEVGFSAELIRPDETNQNRRS